MLDSRKTFLHVMRGLLFLRGVAWEPREAEAVATFARLFDRSMPVLTTLATRHDPGAVENRFAEYLDEIEALAELADGATVR
jgi:hypothetical protein